MTKPNNLLQNRKVVIIALLIVTLLILILLDTFVGHKPYLDRQDRQIDTFEECADWNADRGVYLLTTNPMRCAGPDGKVYEKWASDE